jgi:arylsulfatase A-like enzyme
MRFSSVVSIVLMALSVAAPAQSRSQRPATPRPNILFIVVDDLRPELGCYGRRHVHTPNIDRLAAEGMRFSQAYCQVPVCGASRASVLSGLRPKYPGRFTEAYTYAQKDAPDAVPLPAVLKQNGYTTVSNGKVFHNRDDWESAWSAPPWHGLKYTRTWARDNFDGLWLDPASAKNLNPKNHRGPHFEAAGVPDNAYHDGKLADKTIADMARLARSSQPFFLACGFWRPHLPLNAPKRYWDMYDRADIALADNRFLPEHLPQQCRGSGEILSYAGVRGRLDDDAFHAVTRHAYYACVSYVDAQIGRLLHALDELDLADNTIVVLWADHGWHLGEHTFWGKHNTLHNALQVPLIVRVPGKKPGRCDALVELVDIYPTLCDLAAVAPPAHLEGDSFAPLLDSPDLPWKKAVFSEWRRGRTITTERFGYTRWRDESGKAVARMLFDHVSDPAENRNIAADPSNAETVRKLDQTLDAGWRGIRRQLKPR